MLASFLVFKGSQESSLVRAYLSVQLLLSCKINKVSGLAVLKQAALVLSLSLPRFFSFSFHLSFSGRNLVCTCCIRSAICCAINLFSHSMRLCVRLYLCLWVCAQVNCDAHAKIYLLVHAKLKARGLTRELSDRDSKSSSSSTSLPLLLR